MVDRHTARLSPRLGAALRSIRRREFMSVLGGAVAAWPAAAQKQQPKVFRVGYLDAGARSDPTVQNLRNVFTQGLRELGYVEGRNLRMEDRSAEGELDRLPVLAADLARLPLDLI